MKFYTADIHIDHANIIKYCNRPFKDVAEMYNTIIERWNKKVRPHDTVYILGDTSFSKKDFKFLMAKLNGVKYVLVGNHDAKGLQCMNLPHVIFCPLIYRIKDHKTNLVLCHYPIHEWPGYYKKALHLHGHTHGTIGASFREGAYDVGMDLWNYEPVTLDEILNRKEK